MPTLQETLDQLREMSESLSRPPQLDPLDETRLDERVALKGRHNDEEHDEETVYIDVTEDEEPGIIPGDWFPKLPRRTGAGRPSKYQTMLDAAPVGTWVALRTQKHSGLSSFTRNAAWVKANPGKYKFATRSVNGEVWAFGKRTK